MRILNIKLVNFRNYEKSEFGFEKTNLIIGENGVGKSNILEAIYLLATGKSFRADTDSEMINYDSHHAVIEVFCNDISIKVALTDGFVGTYRKRFEINGVGRRQIDAVGKIKAVMFSPTDMELVTGSPAIRRKYLDFVIIQTNREYRRCLVAYEKGLRQRNKLLDLIRDGVANRTQLFFWDKTLIKNGQYITDKRSELISRFGFHYDKSEISELRLKEYEVEEMLAGSTLVGPHRDDFQMMVEGRDVAKFGSRGQQRMAVWWMKQKEIEYLGDMPVLLLDDIFSELDAKHRESVVKYINNYSGQVIMTSAEMEISNEFKFGKVIRI